MNKLKALIVEDELPNLQLLKRLLKDNFSKEIDIIGDADSVDIAFQKINIYRPKLVFLDIRLNGGDAFNLLDKFQDFNFNIIFTTCYNELCRKSLPF